MMPVPIIAGKTRTRITPQCICAMGEHVTRSVFTLILIWECVRLDYVFGGLGAFFVYFQVSVVMHEKEREKLHGISV